MRHLQCTEVTEVTEAEPRADSDPLSFGYFEKFTVIVKLFLFRNELQGTHIYGALLPKVHACNSHLATVADVGMLRGGETN